MSGSLWAVDSRAALIRAQAEGAERIGTDNPLFAAEAGLVDFDALLAPEASAATGAWALRFADGFDAALRANSAACARDGLTIDPTVTMARPVGVLSAGLVYRAAVLAAALAVHRPAALEIVSHCPWGLQPTTPFAPERFATPWPALLEAGFAETDWSMRIEPAADVGVVNDTGVDDWIAKLMVLPVSVLGGLAAARALRRGVRLPMLGNDDGLLREALWPLMRRGFQPKAMPVPAKAAARFMAPERPADDPALASARRHAVAHVPEARPGPLAPYLSEGEWRALACVLTEALATGLADLSRAAQPAAEAADWIAARCAAGVCLSTSLSDPVSGLVAKRLREAGIRVLGVEHGLTKGISGATRARPHVSEYYNCSRFLAYSEAPRRDFPEEAGDGPGRIDAVGAPLIIRRINNPRLQRWWARRHFGLARCERCIYYVSPFPYAGNMRLGDGSPQESAILALERRLVADVLKGAEDRAFVKPYPTQRYPARVDRAKALGAGGSVRLVDDADFRYTRAAADILISGTPTSTMGWCLGAGVPVVWLDAEIFTPLAPEMPARLEAAVFYVRLDAPDGFERLRAILDLPAEELGRQWREKRPARERLLAEFGFRSAEAPGAATARCVAAAAREAGPA